MQKTLLTLALTGAMLSLSAHATEVEIYGVLDTGFSIQNRDYVNSPTTTTTAMKSGQYMGSRFGIKGTEDLGNGLKVGFSLENGFSSDSGNLSQNGRLFGRDARLFLQGERFGLLSVGRMGPIVGGNGPYARFGRAMSPFSCGWGDVGGTLQVLSLGYDFIDNAIAYTTPKFGNVDASVQYSFGTDTTKYGTGREGSSNVERTYSAALRYQDDTFMVTGGIESINPAQPVARANQLDDAYSYNLGASYKASFGKFYAYGQYFENYAAASKTTTFTIPSGIDGWGALLSYEMPVKGGHLFASVGYGDFKGSHDKALTMKTTQTAVGYLYSLSRRTTLYVGGDWIKVNYSDAYEVSHPKALENIYELIFGVAHKF